MEYTTLDEITTKIIDVMQTAVDADRRWAGLQVLPEILNDDSEGIGFYLFHVQESGHYKNYPAPGKDIHPVNYTPMALNLFYQLSANKNNNNNKEDAIQEQQLMSVAMKALHDNAIILTTSTSANPGGKKINIKITLQTLSPNESIQYWAASQSSVRLSAYYEVSVVFLPPEESKSYSGRVLAYGNYIFVQGEPRIVSSENIIVYNLPGDPVPRQVLVQPAQAPPLHPISPPPPGLFTAPIDSEIIFSGTGFSGGTLKLLIIHPRWPMPAAADSWMVNLISENKLKATVKQTATLQDSVHTTVNILPGLYSAQISKTEQRTLADGSVKVFKHISNQFPFSVMPRIDTIARNTVTGIFTITGFLFQDPRLTQNDIQVFVGEDSIDSLSGVAPLSARQFRITAANTMELRVPAGLSAGTVPLRIMINGVESPPIWISVP